jgi:tripartite-type tricarboxylate transporter receptor subunit TctC
MLRNLKKVTAGLLIFGLVLVGLVGMSYAAYPEKPVTIMVAYRAGGSADTITRTFSPFLSKYLGVPVVVKNMAGAGGMIAMRYIYKQAPDGYMLFNLTLPSYVTRTLYKKGKGYNLKEFTILYGVAGGDSNGIMVPYNSKFATFKEFLAASKKEPIKISRTTPGSNSWLLGLRLKRETGLQTKSVTFDSGRDATLAVVGGHLDGGIAGSSNFPSMIREKKIRVLGVGASKRLSYLPDVPTFIELGYPGVQTVNRQILSGPPGIPADIKKVISKAASKAANDPEYRAIAAKVGFEVEVPALTPEEAQQEVMKAFENIAALLKAEGIK